MNEKEFLLNIVTDREILEVLEMIGDNRKFKNEAFKRHRFKQLLNSTSRFGTQKLSIIEMLSIEWVIKFPQPLTIDEMLKFFVLNVPTIPYLTRYFTLKHYYPNFIEENFEQMVKNVTEDKYFLKDLITFTEEASFEFLSEFSTKIESDFSMDEYIAFLCEKLNATFLEDSKGELDGFIFKNGESFDFKDVTLMEIEQLMMTRGRMDIVTTLIILNFLNAHREIDRHLRVELLNLIKHDLLGFFMTTERNMANELEKQIQQETQNMKQQQKKFKKELRVVEQENKELTKKIKKLTQELNKKERTQISPQIELEKQEYFQKNETLTQKVSMLSNEITKLSEETSHLREELLKHEQLKSFFKRGVKQRYNREKWVIIHNMPLLFIEDIFPEFVFINVNDLKDINLGDYRVGLVQQTGLSYTQRRSITLDLQKNGCSIYEYQAKDERELIMELSVLLKNK